jgi:hypothetical protein
MSQKVAVIVKDGQNVVSNNVVMEGSGAAGKPLIVKAGSKQRIELKDLDTHVAPDQLRVTKDGKNLKIKIGKKAIVEDDAADIIIEGYFDNDASLIGVAENGEYYNFIPQGANYTSYYSLGGEVIGEETATDWMPLVLGLLGAGALAALASGGGGGSAPVDNTIPDSLTIVVYDDSKDPDEVIVSTGGLNQTVLMASSASSNIPVTNDNTPTIKGVTEAGATVTIKDGATTLGTVKADASGNYTFTPATPLNDGTHSIVATSTDDAGNSIMESTGYFIVDTIAPGSVSLTITDNVAPIIGEISNNGVTDDTTPTFTGNTEAGATVTIKDGATVLDTVIADANGNYTFTPSAPLSEGAHSISATATDAAGNTITSTTTNFTVDTTAPAATADIGAITADTGISGDFITNDTTLMFSGTNTALDSGDKVQLSLDGGKTWVDATQTSATTWSYDNSANAMTSGGHTIQVRVIDAAGNAGSVSTQVITIDTTAPISLSVNLTDDEQPITEPIVAGTITNDTTPVISGVTEANATVTAKDDAGNTLGSTTADGSGNYSIISSPLSEGQHYIVVTATDTADNSTTVSSGIFTIDTTAPTAPILDDTDGSIVAGTAEPGSTVTITDGNGNPIGTTTANQNGDFSYTPSTPIADTTVINATATDAAGNESDPGTITVDAKITVAPNVYDDIAPVIGQVFSGDTTNDTQPTISGAAGSVTPGVTVTIYDNGTAIGTTTSNADGSWSFTPTTPFADGSQHSINYTKNGGTEHSPAVDFTVDTSAPSSISMVLTDDVAPAIGTIANSSVTNDTKPTISGVTEAGATVTIKDGSTVLGTITADGSGNYSFTPIAPLNEGAHSINATATDAAGNTITSTTTNFTVDSIAPTIEMTITDDVGAVQGPISNGAIIDDTKPTISGVTEANATVTIKDGDTVLGTVIADADGNYSFTPDTPLSMDEHTITATATDAAGNTTESVSTTFTIAPPEVIDLGDHGQLINPVFVDGNYYYYWDKDKDGEGIINGNPDFDDTFTHDELDAIFMYDVNGTMRPENLTDTNDTYRYAELEGYQVALPTYGGNKLNDGTQVATDIDNVPPGEINPTYDDLVAIWDAFEGHPDLLNGITAENGTPPGWANGIYWSATPYETTQHYAMDFTTAHGGTNAETNQSWTAVQVIF